MGWFKRLVGIEDKEEPRFVMPQMTELPSIPEFIPRQPQRINNHQELEQDKLKEIVYVRLDRFEFSEKAFEDIKLKLKEIESNIRSVDKINQIEDEKLFSWSKDLERLKSLLIKIDDKVFDQI